MPTLPATISGARTSGPAADRRGVRQGGCACDLLSAAFGPPVPRVQLHGVLHGAAVPDLRQAGANNGCFVYLTILLLSVDRFHGWVAPVVLEAPRVSRARRDDAHQILLRAAGADRLVSATELINLTGIDQFSGFSWIGNLLKNVEPFDRPERATGPADRARLESVHRHWIVGQQEYFRRRVARLERDHRRLEELKSGVSCMRSRRSRWSCWCSRSAARAAARSDHREGRAPVPDGPAAGVARHLGAVPEQDGDARAALAVPQSARPFHHRGAAAGARLTTARPLQEILAQVGKEALMESYLWTIHRYHREYEPPAAS